MIDPASPRPGWTYYAAVALFVAVIAFAILGLVRSSIGRTASREPETKPGRQTSPSAALVTPTAPANRPAPTAQIPAPTRGTAVSPPSRTYLYPPPERNVTAGSAPTPQPRR
jgi:uncharacterized protein (DUF58 family)